MNPQATDPNYQPIQFSEAEIKERYERKRQQKEHTVRTIESIKKYVLRSPAELASLKALRHEAEQDELEQGWN